MTALQSIRDAIRTWDSRKLKSIKCDLLSYSLNLRLSNQFEEMQRVDYVMCLIDDELLARNIKERYI